MAAELHGPDLLSAVVLLGAGVVAVPVFKRLGLGSVLGYLAAGLVIGPFGLKFFSDPQTILHVAELGVVMFLFIIGLEMQPSRLWGLRKEIFGLGALQVGVCALLLTGVGIATGFPVAISFVAGAGFVLTSTAIVMQLLEERGEISSTKGQRMVSILLLEDLAIVPLLALVAFLAPIAATDAPPSGLRWMDIGIGVGAVVGILLGLFFLAVGMSLDLSVVTANWRSVLFYVAAFMVVKGIAIYIVARLMRSSHTEALERAVVMAQGGEFAFVLYSTATSVGILDGRANAMLTAIIIISMVLTPIAIIGLRYILPREKQSLDGVDVAEGLSGSVLVIGFGRFGQIASQPLLMRGVDVSIIDNDIEMIQAAAEFGFKVYYGDGTRLDILHAAGAGRAQAVLICVDKPDTILAIAEHIKAEYPLVQVYARSFDRGNTLALIKAGVEYQIRETFESALSFGENTLIGLGVTPEEAAEIIGDVRQRDAERLDLQLAGGIHAGNDLMKGNAPVPGPLVKPRQSGRALSEETARVLPAAQTADSAN